MSDQLAIICACRCRAAVLDNGHCDGCGCRVIRIVPAGVAGDTDLWAAQDTVAQIIAERCAAHYARRGAVWTGRKALVDELTERAYDDDAYDAIDEPSGAVIGPLPDGSTITIRRANG